MPCSFPSRNDKRLNKLILAAEKGCMSLKSEKLYGSEMKRLIKKDGFEISSTPSSIPNLSDSTISWENAFSGGIPLIVNKYITGVIETYPKSHITTLAQELFVTASRVRNKKSK